MNPDPLYFEEPTLRERGWAYAQLVSDRQRRRSSSKAWLLLALGVGAALGFVAGWVAR